MGIKNMIKLHKATELKNLISGDTFMYNNRPHIRLSTYDSDLKKLAKPYTDDGYVFAADTVFFLDEPWNSARKSQAEDRSHRIGQKSTVNIVTLVTKNTIDEKIHQIVEEKRFISDAMIDNLSCADINALLNYLLS